MNVPKGTIKSREKSIMDIKTNLFLCEEKKIRINKKYYLDFLNVSGVMPTDFLNCFEK